MVNFCGMGTTCKHLDLMEIPGNVPMYRLWGDIHLENSPFAHPSVCPSTLSRLNRFSTGAEWSILVFGFAKYSKRSIETQVGYTLNNIIECSSQGAFKMFGAFKMVVVSTGCTIVADHAFNAFFLFCFVFAPLYSGRSSALCSKIEIPYEPGWHATIL